MAKIKSSKDSTALKPTVKTKNPEGKGVKPFTFESFTDVFTLKEVAYSEAFIDQMAQDLANWAANDETALSLTQFFSKRGICRATLYRWIEKYPYMKQAHKFALEVIGARRDVGCLTKKYDGGYGKETLPLYSEDYKAWVLEKAKLKDETMAQSGVTFIYAKRFPSIDSVPEAE